MKLTKEAFHESGFYMGGVIDTKEVLHLPKDLGVISFPENVTCGGVDCPTGTAPQFASLTGYILDSGMSYTGNPRLFALCLSVVSVNLFFVLRWIDFRDWISFKLIGIGIKCHSDQEEICARLNLHVQRLKFEENYPHQLDD